jgi:exopolyphosphatase/guanosine-5'-triphosphate,3'-diphosphate pyrophosphatase
MTLWGKRSVLPIAGNLARAVFDVVRIPPYPIVMSKPKLPLQAVKLGAKANVKLAAIDIGSNAIRLMLAEYSPLGLKPIQKYRVPIRLGGDVFEKGKISGKNLKASARAFRKFRQLMIKAKISQWRAVGTSALREAKNGKSFVELMRRKSGIEIEIIDGVEEAKLIHLGIKKEIHLDTHHCLLIDIGGGSIELTFSDLGMLSATQSFPFGTVRTLDRLKKKRLGEDQLRVVIGDYVQPMSHYISSHNPGKKLDFAVGTGGNLEAIGRLKSVMLKKSSRTSITMDELSQMIEKLSRMTIKERMEKLKLRPDRADVILPAALIAQSAMRLAGIERLLIPYVGLKDGILWSLVGALKK